MCNKMEEIDLQELIEAKVTNGLGLEHRNKNPLYREDDLDLQIELGLMDYSYCDNFVERARILMDLMYMAYLRDEWREQQDENVSMSCCFRFPGDAAAVIYKMQQNFPLLPLKYRIHESFFQRDEQSKIVGLPPPEEVRKKVRESDLKPVSFPKL